MGLKRGSAGGAGLRAELLQLASRLRREHLFVDSEKQELQRLNERVQRSVERLQHLSWICRQQRNALDALVLGRDGSPASCCQRLNALEAACFIDSYRVLGIHDSAYATLLRSLRHDPGLVAMCLVRGPTGQLQAAVDILVSCVYGCGTLSEDQTLMLQLLRELMVLQLEGCDNVRRLLQHGSCAFSRVYKAFTEGLPGAQLFLTSALRTALIQVLVDDDLYLDIDPSKAVVRFPPEERLRHFGPKDSPDYSRRLGAYRAWTIDRLARLAQGFVDGLRSSWPWLPAPLAWLVRRLHAMLTRNGTTEDPRAGVVCADLVFAFFICPAVVSPELHGLVDTHITPIARFNLMQVAQIIQVLALARWERPDPRLSDLYDRFPRDCMSSLLDSLLLGDGAVGGQASQAAAAVPTIASLQQEELARAAFLATEAQLTMLVSFLRSVTWPASESNQQKSLGSLIENLPVPSEAPKRTAAKAVPKKGVDGDDDSSTLDSQPEEVLVIPMPDFTLECPGMLSEEKVLSMEQQKRQTRVRMNVERAVADACDGAVVETIEKRTRFSLSQDQESIGTSDNLEAVSEGASNHSVASSLELENENDNYSDMVSANVSGHGTPNVSGRDTPSSQVEEEPMERPPTNRNQADIEDKFGKFEISPAAPVQGDETKSIVSDTWSTDVLASDSEMLDQVNLVAQMQLLESHFQSTLEAGGDTGSDAWSTDVAASDNERLQDVDTDDTGSLARSDDTRSEISAGGDEEVAPPPVTDRSALRHSHHHHHHHHRHHHRRSNLRPPPQSPKQPLLPHQLGAAAATCADSPVVMAQALAAPRAQVPPADSLLESPRASAMQEQLSPTLDGALSPTQSNTSSSTGLAPSELSFFDPLAVQVELRHPEKIQPQDKAAAPSSGDGVEEDVTPTGTQATPSPSGGAVAGDPTCRSTAPKGGGASPIPPTEGMQSLGRLSLAVKELPEEEALLLLQSEEEAGKASTEDDRGTGDKRAKNFFKAKLSQFRFSFKPKQRKSNEVIQNGPDTPRSVLPDVGSDAADILEKYRGAGPAGGIVGAAGAAGSTGASPSTPLEPLQQAAPQPPLTQGGSEEALVEDAQKKLRLVLALADLPQGGPQEPAALLQGLLAQATLLHNKTLASHVHEALRCLRLLDELQCLRVLRALEEEHRRRAPYIAYLVRCRQGLLAVQAQLETRLRRTQRDRDVCQTHLATLCVRHFLDPREPRVQAFSRSFQGLTAADDKAELVEQFLQYLFQQMEIDPTWQMASDVQINLAQRTIERAIMSQIYVHALYPNGDGDVLRDQVLHQHIQKLSRVVTVEHRDLRIPQAFHAASPWPSAQAQLGALAAHKSPQDKVACVAACCASLASLLSAAAGAPAAADDLVPVLVFVLIRANPPHLLSTVQFVETFQRASRRCQGEAAYWWTLFCAAIEFIKTMDY